MNEINKINLTEQTKFRLSEIIGIENYFHQEINQRKPCSKKLIKYVTAFDYIDKILIVSSATSALQFQIIAPPPNLLVFGFFVGPPPCLLFPRLYFADISEIVETDCSFCETVSNLV